MALEKFIATSRTVSAGKKPKPDHLMRDAKGKSSPCGCGDKKGDGNPPAKPSDCSAPGSSGSSGGCECGCKREATPQTWLDSLADMDLEDDEDDEEIETKNCGVGSEGFEQGNTCGSGDGGGGGGGESSPEKPSADDKPKKPSKPKKPKVGKPEKGSPPAEGVKPPKAHSVDLPSNPRRIGIDQTETALRSMGYEMTKWTPSATGTTVSIRDSAGKEVQLPSYEVVNMIYANSNDPKANAAPAIKPRKSFSSPISQKALWADPDAPAGILTKATRRDAEEEFEDITEDEKAIGGAVSKVLERQVSAVIKEINAAGAPTAELVQKVETLLRSAKWNEQIVTALRPYLQTALENGIGLGIETVSKMASVPNFTPNRDDLKAYAQSESVRLARRAATGVNRYTSVRVGEILGNGIAEGETIGQLASRVQEWAGEKGDAERATRRRALTIARTEAQRASRAAEVEAWRSTGLVEGKTWLLAPDPCEFCEAASKSFSDNAVSIDEPFYQKGEELEGADGGKLTLDYEAVDGPPLHPNCRCSLQPRLIDDYENLFRELDAELEAKEADE